MKIYFAADHAGFALKHMLCVYVQDELLCEAVDCGAASLQPDDDYPEIIAVAAGYLAADVREGRTSRAIFIGASGQGEAMAANRFRGVRAAVYYGGTTRSQRDTSGTELDILASSRAHNDANALSLGARFLTFDEAKAAVKIWLETSFSEEERHKRRIRGLDMLV
jgi:ribose 5-phosphate isomerase B